MPQRTPPLNQQQSPLKMTCFLVHQTATWRWRQARLPFFKTKAHTPLNCILDLTQERNQRHSPTETPSTRVSWQAWVARVLTCPASRSTMIPTLSPNATRIPFLTTWYRPVQGVMFKTLHCDIVKTLSKSTASHPHPDASIFYKVWKTVMRFIWAPLTSFAQILLYITLSCCEIKSHRCSEKPGASVISTYHYILVHAW